jgi:hypothetical protein
MSILFLALGWISLAVGLVGAFLPVLPTTPFVILAAYFFSKGSPRMQRWIEEHPRFGPYVRDWRRHRVIPMRAKVVAHLMLAASLAFSLYRIPERLWPVKIFVSVSVLGASVFILTRKSRI